jgi:serine/threonine protein kinase
MPIHLEDCPDSQTLVDFLLGKLPTDVIEDCRQHLEDCDPCVETIRGLKIDDDTLNGLSREAWIESAKTNGEQSESQIINALMQRMEGLSIVGRSTRLSKARVVEDRAAEVQRLLDAPESDQELGRIEQYSIVELLGAGSTGVVYRAVDSRLNRTVALKILRPSLGDSARERFVAEARATAMLNHPNVVPIYEVGSSRTLAYIAMLWEPGQTLEQLLEDAGNLPIDETIELGKKLSAALAHAHQRGLIHRDIKPANVWIPTELGMSGCKVLDFGLVRITDEDPQLTCTGMIAGTPCYMSPEQSRGQDLDGRSDLFSLGCVIYQSLTGQLPFRCDNALSTLQSIQRDQPTAPNELDPSISTDLSDLVLSLLEKSPNRRPPNAQSVEKAIGSPRKEWPFEVTLSTPNSAKPQSARSNSIGVWKSLATLFAGLALGIFGLMYGPQVTRIVTNQGVVEIDTKVDDVKIEVLQNGNRIEVIDLATKETITLTAGKYEIRPIGNGNSVSIENDDLALKRGGKEIVTIRRREPSASLAGTPKSTPQPAKPTPSNYELAAGDVLGIFVEGVLGSFGKSPPVNIPPVGSDMPPSIGYPISIDADGTISLPLVDPIQLSGMTISQAERAVAAAFQSGEDPILKLDGRIIVCLMMKRESNLNPSHKIQKGDVLSIFIEGVLGTFDGDPPVHFPDATSNHAPSMGYPIPVRDNGEVSLPLVKPIKVEGLSLAEARKAIKAPYFSGDEPILDQQRARLFVSLMRTRENSYRTLPEMNSSLTDAGDRLPSPSVKIQKSSKVEFRPFDDAEQPEQPKHASGKEKLWQLERAYKIKKELFVREQIDALELMETELDLLEYKFNAIVVNHSGPDPSRTKKAKYLQRILEIRESQYEHAKLMLDSPPQPGGSSDLNDRILARDEARSRLSEARKHLHQYEKFNQVSLSLPIYNGKTYEECLVVTKTERDFEKLLPAMKGLANLASEVDQDEVDEVLMEIFRRKLNLAASNVQGQILEFRQAYFRSLDPERLHSLILNELATGSATGIQAFTRDFHHIVPPNSIINESNSTRIISQTIGKRFQQTDDKSLKRSLHSFFYVYDQVSGCTGDTTEAIKPMVEEFFEENLKSNASFLGLNPDLVAMHAPDSKGFVERIELELAKKISHNEFQKIVSIANALPENLSRRIAPAAINRFLVLRLNGGPYPISDSFQELFLKDINACKEALPELMRLKAKITSVGTERETSIDRFKKMVLEREGLKTPEN